MNKQQFKIIDAEKEAEKKKYLLIILAVATLSFFAGLIVGCNLK